MLIDKKSHGETQGSLGGTNNLNSDLNIFYLNIFNKLLKQGIVEEVIHGCARCFDGRILDCKLAMDANRFDEIQRNVIHDPGRGHNGVTDRSDVSSLDRL